jgi:hypothetical protein
MATQVTLNSGSVDSAGSLALKTNGTTTAVTINASQGVEFNAGAVGTPSITTTGDTNTGIFFPAADTIAFAEGGAEAMRIDSSGNVGVNCTANNFGANYRTVEARGASTTISGVFRASSSDASQKMDFFIENGVGILRTDSNHPLSFSTNSTERARIDTSGNLLVGTTTTSGGAKLYVVGSGASNVVARFYNPDLTAGNPSVYFDKPTNTTTTSQIFVAFTINSQATGSGQINANGASAAAFGSFSDSRLKENIVDLPSQLDSIMALRPVEFDYIESEGGGHQIGFIAQEVQTVYPDLIGERADGMLTLTDLNKNDARLIKAIQEMKAIIDTQASTITTLTDRITALEAK